MALEITDWNILPNQRFFVLLHDTGAGIDVDIFNTKADLDADINRVAFANGPYGADVLIVITADSTEPSSGDSLSKFNPSLAYDLKTSGVNEDPPNPDVKLQVGPFTDLDPIEDALLVTEAMIEARATLELNRGTHSAFRRILQLDKHYEDLEEGDIVSLTITKRGLVAEPNRIDEIAIEVSQNDDGEINMFDVIDVTVFEDVVR
jgi:hypothetical protein